MQGKTTEQKQSQLRKNVELNTARSIRAESRALGGEVSTERKQEYRDMMEESARAIERKGKLDGVWNKPSVAETDTSKRPELGYFGGVNFDDDGKIIR